MTVARTRSSPEAALAEAIRAELAAVEPSRACDRAAERAGLGPAARGRARTPVVARLAVRLEDAGGVDASFDWAAARDHCRLAWLRGVFLARGSLSLAEGRVHLEFVVPDAEAATLAAYLGELGLTAAARLRRGAGVVTWKSTESVIRFLRLAGASATVLDLESRLVTRNLRGHLNRVLNAETANLERSVRAARRQIDAIEALDAAGGVERLPRPERAVARLRRASPDASLTELAAELGVSRARVQRALVTIESAARSNTVAGER